MVKSKNYLLKYQKVYVIDKSIQNLSFWILFNNSLPNSLIDSCMYKIFQIFLVKNLFFEF